MEPKSVKRLGISKPKNGIKVVDLAKKNIMKKRKIDPDLGRKAYA